MTGNEMISVLQEQLGRIGTVLDTQILLHLKLAQTEAERGPIIPWFLNTWATAPTAAGEPRLEMPSDFLREAEGGGFFLVYEGKDNPLKKWDLDSLRTSAAEEDPARPTHYAFQGKYLWLYRVPDQTYTVRLNYYKKDTAPAATDTENLWSLHYPDLLIGLAGQKLCTIMRALDIRPVFDDMVQLAWQQMTNDETARESANMEREMQDD